MDSTLQPGITAHWKTTLKKNSAKRDGEKRGVGSFGAQGLHHARHPVESRKNGEGLTCPGLSSTKPGWAQLHITAQSVPLGETMKKWLPAVVWRRGVVTMVVVVVVVVVAPKWNEQRKNEPGVLGTREVGGRGAGDFNRWVPLTRSSWSSGGPAEDGGGGSMLCK